MLARLPNLSSLTLSHNKLGDAAVNRLAQGLESIHPLKLECLDLAATGLSARSLPALSNVVTKLPRLRFLYLLENDFSEGEDDSRFAEFCQTIYDHPATELVVCRSCGVNRQGVAAMTYCPFRRTNRATFAFR